MKEKTIRQSNYELMRIVSMFFIVFWHVLLHTGAVNHSTGFLRYASLFLYLVLSVHTNSYMLVSGYFQYKKPIKTKKILSVVGIAWFYNLVLTLIGLFLLHYEFTNLQLAQNTSPLNINGYWYITGYVLLMFFAPILNKFIENTNQKEHKTILIVFFILFSIIPFITRNSSINNDGRSILQFIFLYLIGAYLGKYPIEESYHFKKNSKEKNRIIYISIFFSCMIIKFLVLQFGSIFENIYGSIIHDFYDTIAFTKDSFSSPMTLIASICFFLYFGTLDFKSKWINKISSLTLGVYLFHENRVTAKYIYDNWISSVTVNDTTVILLQLLVYAIIIFIISAFVEWIRQILAKLIFSSKSIKKISSKLDNYIKNF
ncbi:MAG: acyltransferase [Bacilli bacterium]|nr:acyltransferase [Bacilli bacterium]